METTGIGVNANDLKAKVSTTNCDSDNDLSDGEWEEAKQSFRLFQEEYFGGSWEALATKTNRNSASTLLREGTNRQRRNNPLTARRHANANQDECCPPKNFVPLDILTKVQVTETEKLVDEMHGLDLNVSKEEMYMHDALSVGSSSSESWSFPPECKSPRFADSFDKDLDDSLSGKDDDEDEEDALSVDTESEAVSVDDSKSSSENSWHGSLSEDIIIGTVSKAISNTELIILSSDDDEDEEDGTIIAQPITKQTLQSVQAKRVPSTLFNKTREKFAVKLFNQFDQTVFDGKLKAAGIQLSWSRRLTSTAGKTIVKLGRGIQKGVCKVDIVLSATILDRETRLQSTLLHEMCHAAAWIVDKNDNPPHGPVFQKWAELAQARTGVAVTTTHTYSIAKYAWACKSAACTVKILRPTNSFKPDAVVCAKCGSGFVAVNVETGEPLQLRAKKLPSKYNIFVKEQSQTVRKLLEAKSTGRKVSQGEVMAELAKRWKLQARTVQ
jgi:predicted SprT family Zn-dependent metalloprotease